MKLQGLRFDFSQFQRYLRQGNDILRCPSPEISFLGWTEGEDENQNNNDKFKLRDCFQPLVVPLSKSAIRECHQGIVCAAPTKGNFYAEKQIYSHDEDDEKDNNVDDDGDVETLREDHCMLNQVKD